MQQRERLVADMRVSLRDDGFLSQLKCMEESHQEATEKEVERILGLLQTYFREDREYGTTLKGAAAVVCIGCATFCKVILFKRHFSGIYLSCDSPPPPFF